ncbi:MAG: methyltransferase family protein, partial [Polyangia bacterium]
ESKQGGARVRFPPPLVFVALIAIGVGLRYVVLPPPLPLGRMTLVVVGAILAAGALLLGGSAFGLFKKSGQNPKPWTPAPSLVLQGVYRFTRNPMYVSMALLQIAIGLMLANLWVIVLAAVSLLVVHYIAVLPEEAYLDEKFGESYRQYKKSVRRYL